MFGNLINKAMGAAKALPSLAKSMIEKDIQVYDASQNTIIIAGREMNGWEHAHISDVELTKEYLGSNGGEFALVKQVYARKLSMSFLPTEISILKLEELATLCINWDKHFMITVIENGTWVADYKAQFSTVGGIKMQAEGENVTFEFYLKPAGTRAAQTISVTPNTPVAIETSEEAVVAPPQPQ